MNQTRTMSSSEAIVVGSRLLAVIVIFYALAALSNLPETIYSFRRNALDIEPPS
jgi:hypothetical protein